MYSYVFLLSSLAALALLSPQESCHLQGLESNLGTDHLGQGGEPPLRSLKEKCNIFTACHVRPLFYLSALPSILGLSFTLYGFSSVLRFKHFSSTVVTQYTFNTLEEKRFNLRTWTQVLELSRQLSRGVNWPPCSVALESTRTTECYSMLFIWFHMSFGSSPYLFGFCD